MINKLEIIEEHLNNIQFHIDHVNQAMVNPEFYQTPLNKTTVDLNEYLSSLMSQKEALENEKQTLTNQD
jgi:hypothetical protein